MPGTGYQVSHYQRRTERRAKEVPKTKWLSGGGAGRREGKGRNAQLVL